MKKFLFGILSIIILASTVGWLTYDIEMPTPIHNGADVAEKNDIKQTTVENKEENAKKLNLAEQYKMDSSFILIRKSEFKLYTVDKNGVVLSTYNCALGKNIGQKEKEGDMKTPDGIFPIDEIIDASTWSHDFKDGKGEIQGAYGPWFISLDTTNLSGGRWGGIGIHGTHAPESIGTRISEGCIRLNNNDIVKLKQFAKVGMKVIIEE